MSRKVFEPIKALQLIISLLMAVSAFQLASCVAGSHGGTTEAAAEQAPAPVRSVMERQQATAEVRRPGKEVSLEDVTSYYRREQIAGSRSGRGLATFEMENFVGSGRCAACHELLEDSAGNDMSIPGHWRSTMMANASKDPLWQAKVSSEVKRNPALKKVIEEKCATCHMPLAWTQAYTRGEDRFVLDQGLLSPKNDLHQAAMDGVSCTLCHQIQDEKLGKKESFSGKFVIDTSKPAPEKMIFGPYKDPKVEPMRQSIGFTPVYGPHTNDSALCATCHTLYTPYVDAQGNVVGEFPEQTPFLEWKYSDFGVNADNRYDIGENPGRGKICQECHMPHSDNNPVTIARWAPPSVQPKDHFSQHHFVGGNAFMLDILQENIDNLGLAASTERFGDTRERTMHQLQTATAGLTLSGLESEPGLIAAEIKVDNLAGHKFPSGIPIRRAWIHLKVTDATGGVVFESGRQLDDGSIEGNDGDRDSGSYEPHYDEITQSDQVQIYEGVMLNTDNEVTHTLLRAAGYAKDNRLLPSGFDKHNVPTDIGVFGKALGDQDFVGGSDRVTYRIKTNGHQGPFALTARLVFTAVSYGFVRDLSGDRDLTEVNRFMFLYDKADKTGEEVAAFRAMIR